MTCASGPEPESGLRAIRRAAPGSQVYDVCALIHGVFHARYVFSLSGHALERHLQDVVHYGLVLLVTGVLQVRDIRVG